MLTSAIKYRPHFAKHHILIHLFMSDQSDFISQIQKKEIEAKKLIEKAEKDNNQRVVKAEESADQIVLEAEEATKKVGYERLAESKETAKDEYKKVLVEFDSRRRDQIESGRGKMPKAKSFINKKVVDMFKSSA
jgi:vacuolar-type H+-ATPase subunit H